VSGASAGSKGGREGQGAVGMTSRAVEDRPCVAQLHKTLQFSFKIEEP